MSSSFRSLFHPFVILSGVSRQRDGVEGPMLAAAGVDGGDTERLWGNARGISRRSGLVGSDLDPSTARMLRIRSAQDDGAWTWSEGAQGNAWIAARRSLRAIFALLAVALVSTTKRSFPMIFALLAAVFIGTTGFARADEVSPRERISIDRNWRFTKDDPADVAKDSLSYDKVKEDVKRTGADLQNAAQDQSRCRRR